MNKLFLSVILPILTFALVMGGSTTYTVLEAFVLDREIAESPVDRRPASTNPADTTLTAPDSSSSPESTTPSDSTNAPSTDDTPSTEDTPSTDETVDTTEPPVTEETPVVTYPIIGDLYYKGH